MFFRKKIKRENLYRSVFLFTIIYFILMYFQKRILLGLFQTQLSFLIPSVVSIITSQNTLDELISRGTNGAILTGAFLAIEIIAFILLILYFLFQLWRLYKNNKFKIYDYSLLAGLIILLFGSFYYAYVVASTSLETYNTIFTALNRLSPTQLQKVADKWTEFLYNYQFSLGYLPRDVSLVIDQVNTIIASVKDIANIPDVINHYLNRLSELKFHYFMLMCLGFGILLVTQVLEYKLIIRSFRKLKFSKKPAAVQQEQMVQLLGEQQELMSRMIDLQEKNNQSVARGRKYYRQK